MCKVCVGNAKRIPLASAKRKISSRISLPLVKFGCPVRYLEKKVQQDIQTMWSEIVKKHLNIVFTGVRMGLKDVFDAFDKILRFSQWACRR